MVELSRKHCFRAGLTVLTLYFIYEGLNHTFNYHAKSRELDMKLYNIETHFETHYKSIAFPFRSYLPLSDTYDSSEHASSYFSKLVILLYGIATLSLGCLVYFFDDKRKRSFYAQILIFFQIFDAFVLHLPFIEAKNFEHYSNELTSFTLTLVAGFSLIMVVGLREH